MNAIAAVLLTFYTALLPVQSRVSTPILIGGQEQTTTGGTPIGGADPYDIDRPNIPSGFVTGGRPLPPEPPTTTSSQTVDTDAELATAIATNGVLATILPCDETQTGGDDCGGAGDTYAGGFSVTCDDCQLNFATSPPAIITGNVQMGPGVDDIEWNGGEVEGHFQVFSATDTVIENIKVTKPDPGDDFSDVPDSSERIWIINSTFINEDYTGTPPNEPGYIVYNQVQGDWTGEPYANTDIVWAGNLIESCEKWGMIRMQDNHYIVFRDNYAHGCGGDPPPGDSGEHGEFRFQRGNTTGWIVNNILNARSNDGDAADGLTIEDNYVYSILSGHISPITNWCTSGTGDILNSVATNNIVYNDTDTGTMSTAECSDGGGNDVVVWPTTDPECGGALSFPDPPCRDNHGADH